MEVEFHRIYPSRDRFGFQIPDWIVGQSKVCFCDPYPFAASGRFTWCGFGGALCRSWWILGLQLTGTSVVCQCRRLEMLSVESHDEIIWTLYGICIWFCMNFVLVLDFRQKRGVEYSRLPLSWSFFVFVLSTSGWDQNLGDFHEIEPLPIS